MKLAAVIIIITGLAGCVTAQEGGGIDAGRGADTIIGIYANAFEASILYPCSEPGTEWWLTPNAEFAEQYDSLPRMGDEVSFMPGPYAFVQVDGELTETGEYGHFGAYEREFTVTEVFEIQWVAGEPEGDRHVWVHEVCEDRGVAD